MAAGGADPSRPGRRWWLPGHRDDADGRAGHAPGPAAEAAPEKPHPAAAGNPPIEQIAGALRRMLRTHDGIVRTSGIATTARRVRAVEAAISTAALQAARALEVPHPKPAPYEGLETWQLHGLLRALRPEGLVLPADVRLTKPDSPF